MLKLKSRSYLDHLGRPIYGLMPIANQGDKGTYLTSWEVVFGTFLSYNISLTLSADGSTWTLNGLEWSDLGISAGDVLTFVNLVTAEGVAVASPIIMAFDTIDGSNGYPSTYTGSGETLLFVSGQVVAASKIPQSVRTNIYLIPSDQNSGNGSLIDGTSLTMVNNDISTMTIGQVLPLTLIGSKSGGGVISASIKNLSAPSTYNGSLIGAIYQIKIDFYWWHFLNNFKNYFFDTSCLTPYVEVSFLPTWNNPGVNITNGVKYTTDGNSGFRDENFNQNPNNFKIVNMSWNDLTNTIGGFDYSKPCGFSLEIENLTGGGFGDFSGLLMFNDIEDSDIYSSDIDNNNGDYSHLEHTIFSSETGIGKISAGNSFDSALGVNGEQLSFVIDSSLSGSNLLIDGIITPNAAFISKFSDDNNVNKHFTLLWRVESETFTPSNYSDTVNLTAWAGEGESYPAILGSYFISASVFDHADNLIYNY